ncbi:hypothetical protein BVX97_04350 [bacterium E08(2017)]|nr:hypothetical protein BVX97_04350 [bacterium E08(2017)]
MIYKRDNDVVKRRVAGETFLIPVKNKLADMRNIYVLHGAGEFIWDHLDKDTDAIVDGMVDEFEVARDEAERDLEDYLSELLKAELLEEA